MPSLFTWIDYSEADRRRVMDVVSLLDEKQTRDELGLSSIRDSMADLFFLGTSTIQTRAKYFLFVPWNYQKLANGRTPSKVIATRAREEELNLMQIIEKSSDAEGNIGRVARERLKRLPSNIYWQGLASWGIRRFYGSQDQFHRSLDSFYLHESAKRHRSEEDELEEAPISNWDRGLVKPPDIFPENSSFELSVQEAEYLADRIRYSHPESLLAKLVKIETEPIDGLQFVWQHPKRKEFSAVHQNQLMHAENFSDMMQGAMLVYNLMLARQTGWDDSILVELIDQWAQEFEAAIERFQSWSRIEFWALIDSTHARVGLPTRRFVEEWWDICLKDSLRQRIESPAVYHLVTVREKQLKKGLARLQNTRAGELWTGQSGLSKLDFRWRVTVRILNDIIKGRNGGQNDA